MAEQGQHFLTEKPGARTIKLFTTVMEQTFIRLPLIIEGATEKVLQFKMLLKLMCGKNLCLNEQKCIFEHCRKIKTLPN